MTSAKSLVLGMSGYAESADDLAAQYESVTFDEIYGELAALIPDAPARILDVGAGTGRDAAALAAKGHLVVAAEPTAELRAHGQRLHPSDKIIWVDDSLPLLRRVDTRQGPFDVIVLTAVWMHLDASERPEAMSRLRELLAPRGVVLMSLRHGPVPPGRRMFDVAADEVARQGQDQGLELAARVARTDMLGRADVHWTLLALAAGT